MKYRFSNQQRMLQKMSLTPQMRQSIQLLGMSASDISEYIETLLIKNPFLQKLIDEKKSEKYNNSPASRNSVDSSNYDDSRSENPRFAILSQLRILGLKGKALEIAEYLVFEMDENGYITAEIDDVATNLSVDAEAVEKCLSAIQSLEPAGIGARDIRECLQLQLKRKGKEDSLEYEIISDFLNDVARNDIEKIADALEAEKEKVQGAINYIKKLNPRPASGVLAKEAEQAVPELLAKVNDKSVRLELNRGSLPRLKIYNPYENELDVIKDPEARKFLKENLDLAKGLVDNLKRREDTLCKVAKYILDFQKDIIAKSDLGLKTLTIRDVAKALDFHPSTISRAVSNKYIQINDKVVPMNTLLSHGMPKANGEFTSKTAIKNTITEIIRNENSEKPLSDDEIKEALKKEGTLIERRTVAKYRNALRILPKYLRKKVKSA